MKQAPAVVVAIVLVVATRVALGSATALRSVRVTAQAAASAVLLEADGPLPAPKAGVLEAPPRIYLDFEQVTPATRGLTVTDDPLVRGVRVALYRAEPPTTRVVIDLTAAARYRIEAHASDPTRLTVIVGVPSAAPPPTPARVTASSPGTSGSTVSTTRAPAKNAERYMTQASDALGRLDRLRPLLASLDDQAVITDESLRAGAEEFDAVRRALGTVEPPPPLKSAHELLRTACLLGALSATTRLEASRTRDARGAPTAASAAAGSLLLLDRARSELGSSPAVK
jgi:hypothetical protein